MNNSIQGGVCWSHGANANNTNTSQFTTINSDDGDVDRCNIGNNGDITTSKYPATDDNHPALPQLPPINVQTNGQNIKINAGGDSPNNDATAGRNGMDFGNCCRENDMTLVADEKNHSSDGVDSQDINNAGNNGGDFDSNFGNCGGDFEAEEHSGVKGTVQVEAASNVVAGTKKGFGENSAHTEQKETSADLKELHDALVLKDAEIASLKAIRNHDIEEKALSKADNAVLTAILRQKDDEIALLKATLKNSKPIDAVDLTKSETGLNCNDNPADHTGKVESVPKSNLAIQLEQNQAMVQVKREKKDTESALENVRDDLDISNDTLTQLTVFLDFWQSKFDELASLAAAGGVDGSKISIIRRRLFPSRP